MTILEKELIRAAFANNKVLKGMVDEMAEATANMQKLLGFPVSQQARLSAASIMW